MPPPAANANHADPDGADGRALLLILSEFMEMWQASRQPLQDLVDCKLWLALKLIDMKVAQDMSDSYQALRLISETEARAELDFKNEQEEQEEALHRRLELECIYFNMPEETREAILEAFSPGGTARRPGLVRRASFP
jgi:hypothetical protein